MRQNPFKPWRLFALLLVTLIVASGEEPARRPLSEQDFDAWSSIRTPRLSRDGQWLAYSYIPQVGNGHVVLRNLTTGAEQREPVGAIPPLPFPLPTSVNEQRPQGAGIGLHFTSDNRYLLITTLPTQAEAEAARKAGKKGAAAPKRGLLITTLATGKTRLIEAVKSVQVPARGGSWVAYLLEPAATPEAPATKEDATEKKQSPATGSTLVLCDLATGAERTFAHVTEYSLTRDAGTLLFAVSAPEEKDNGVYAASPGKPDAPVAVLTGKGRYMKLVWDLAQTQAAFLSDRDAHDATPPDFTVYLWPRGAATARRVVAAYTPGMAPGMVVSEKAAPAFSLDGRKLYVGVAPKAEPDPAPAPDSEDKVTADIWSWTDDLIQPRQAVRASVDRDRTYRGVLDLTTYHYAQLATPDLPDITLSDHGNGALGFAYAPYYRLRDYDGTYADIYIVDPATGGRRLAITKLRGASGDEGTPSLGLSPDGRWATFFSDRQWHALNLTTGQVADLTSKLPVTFVNEDHDQPEPPPSHGWAGWVNDSQSMLLYDRYDLWQVYPDGRPARNLTHGYGRAHKLILRRQDITAREEDDPRRGVDPSQPLVLRGESEETRASGFYRLAFGDKAPPQHLLWADKEYRYTGRALDADTLMLTASRFDEYPDVWITNEAFATPHKATDGGAQLQPFAWGSAELVNFTNADGVPLQALLYKPANFDPNKQYPLIIYTYQRLAQILHRFFDPGPGSNINFPFYASNGYLVMLTDIVYTTGHPGQSAMNCVLPAIDTLVARGYVDENAIGIQGSSWGGYTAAYLITHTDRFRAAEAGAVVGNMTSAYGGIRWTSGQPRLFQYEQSQSRIGQALTDAPELYLENSPVFHAKNAHTPLLIQHNDRDGAVPWYQAIELYLALRRHNKPVWLINYHDEGHGLSRRADQKDFSRRMWQFFDHFLRGAPAPDWLKNGVPYLERDAEKIRFNGTPCSVKPAS